MGRALALAAVLAVGVASWTHLLTRESNVASACGAFGPYDFDTLEMADHVANYRQAINLLVEGKVFSSTFESAGETVDLRYQGLEAGNRAARAGGGVAPSTAYRIPPSVYYSTAWIEANWANASTAVPWGGVGPVIRSFDCGYGLGQITSGMANSTGTPSSKQALIGTHFMFNLAEGMRILADKWNQAPELRPIAGNGDPAALEDWYYAIWSYNGFAFINHPFHPDRDPLRAGTADSPIYHCYDASAPSYVKVQGSSAPMFAFSDYTYPEKVYGCMRHPAQREGSPMWEPVAFNMPDFERPEVLEAFDPKHFLDCDGHLQGCVGMDFPTSFPDDLATPGINEAVSTHQDPAPPADTSQAAQYLGAPSLVFDGPAAVSLEATQAGVIQSASVTATNVGSFVAPFRVRSTERWLVVRGPGDPSSRSLDGGVAVGAGTSVVVTLSPLLTKAGHSPELEITLDPAFMPRGQSLTATVYFEPLLGDGESFSVTVTGLNNFIAPPTPTPTVPPVSRGDFIQYMPGISADP